MRGLSLTQLLLGLFTLIILGFLLTPAFLIAWASFGSSETLNIPPRDYSLRWHEHLFADFAWRRALSNSVQVALAAAAVSLVASVTAAFALMRVSPAWRVFVFAIFLVPILFPAVSLGVGQLGAFAWLRLPESTARLALGHLAICLPVSFLIVSLALFGPNQRFVQRALAFTDHRSFVLARIVAPLMGVQLIGAGIVAFLFSFDEPVLSQFLSGPITETIPRRIFTGIRFELDPTAAAVTLIVFLAWLATSIIFFASDDMKSEARK